MFHLSSILVNEWLKSSVTYSFAEVKEALFFKVSFLSLFALDIFSNQVLDMGLNHVLDLAIS